MSVPPIGNPVQEASLYSGSGGITQQDIQNILNAPKGMPDIPLAFGNKGKGVPSSVMDVMKATPSSTDAQKNAPDFGSVAKDIIDFLSTPLYMVTNTAIENQNDPDQNNIGNVLNDIGKGVSEGWKAGIEHDPNYARDWTDVIQNSPGYKDSQNSDQWKDYTKGMSNLGGFVGDLVLDPLNLIPGAGIAKGVLKGTGEAISAGREASRAGGRILDSATEAAAKAGAEPLAEAVPAAEHGAVEARESGDAAGASPAPETAPEAPSAPPASGASGADKAVETFSNMPEAKQIIANQDLGVLPAMAKAFGSAFTGSVKGSETGQIVSKILDKFKDPIQVTPEAHAAAHIESVINKDALKTEPVATISAPEAEVPNPEKDIAEKHFGEGGHDTFKAIQDAVNTTNWARPADRNLAKHTADYNRQVAMAGAAGMDQSQIPSLQQYLDKAGFKPKADIDHPFKTGNVQDSQSYLRERATPEEQAKAARAVGVSEHAPPAEITKTFFSHKEKYLAAEKDINALYKREADTPLREAKEAARKQQDIRNSATMNTLTKGIYDDATPAQLDATRAGMAKQYVDALNKNERVAVYGAKPEGGGKRPATTKNLAPARQHKIAADMTEEVYQHQMQKLDKQTKSGHRITNERAAGKSDDAIVHPLLYPTEANQLMFKSAISHLKTEMNDKLSGQGFSISKFPQGEALGLADIVTKHMKAAESTLAARGMIPALKWAGGKNAEPIRLFLGDILEAAMKSSTGIKASDMFTSDQIRRFLIGSARKDAIDPTAMITAAERLIRDRQAIHAAMEKAGGALPPEEMEKLLQKSENNITATLMGNKNYYPGATKAEVDNIKNTIKAAVEARGEGANAASYATDMAKVAKALVRDPHLGMMLEQRHLLHEAVHAADIKKLAENNWSDLEKNMRAFMEEDRSPEAIVQWLNSSIKDAKEALPFSDRSSYEDSINKLKEEVIQPEEERAATAKDPSSTLKDSEKTAKEVLAVKNATDPEYIPDPLDVHLGKIATDMMRAMHPVRFFFDAKFPFLGSAFYTAVLEGNHARARTQMMMDQALKSHIMKNNGEGQLLKDFEAIQKGEELTTQSSKDLFKIVGTHFQNNRFAEGVRAGKIPASYVKNLLESKGILKYVDEKWLESAKNKDLIDFWRHVPMKDTEGAADFLSRVHSAMSQAYTDLATVRDFEQRFGTTDINRVKAGTHAKLTWSGKGKATKIVRNKGYNFERARAENKAGLWDLLDKNKYYDRVAAKEIPAIHRLMNESRSLGDDNGLKRFVNNVYDPWTQLIKSFQTTFRPGHWTSNLMGDTIRMHLAGVRPQDIGPALKVLKAGAKDEGFANDIPAKFQRLTDEANRKFSTKLPDKDTYFFTTINGKKTAVSHTEAARRFETNGTTVSGSHGQHEDLLNREDMDMPSVGKFAKSVNSGLNKVMNIGDSKGISIARMQALRDNLTRTPIAMKVLQSGNFKSLDDAFEQAFAEVRKWAPTSMDFTREESIYARRVMLYYTWLRGMLPNIVETLMEKPGTFLAPNKVLYGIAKANGVDPASIGDPFPTDQKFPSYYFQNVIGPQIKADGGQLWGFSPMAPTIDILDQLTGNINTHNQKLGAGNQAMAIGDNIVGMLNPMFKMPLELAAGQSGGVPIKDPVQYIQDEVAPPQLDLISKMTGKDINGQNRTDNPNGATDLLNFLSGMHWTQYNSPTAERAVAGEQKAEKSAMRADAKRAAK